MRKIMMKTKYRVIAISTALIMALTPAASFALDTQGNKEAFKEFSAGGYTYYDIYNGQTEGRPEVDDMETLIEQTIYGKKNGQNYSVAEYWATLAADIFAANSQSYRSYNDDKGHGASKSADAYNKRFKQNVEKGRESYGNLQSALSAKSQKKMSTGNNKKYRKCDINTIVTGKQTAKNLSQVQDAAFQLLVDVNPGKIKKSDFKSQNELKALSDDTGSGDVIYHLMATRDRDGGTFRYIYNCFGIAYSDFTISPQSGDNGEGVTTALKGYDTLDAALAESKEIEGFKYSDNNKEINNAVINKEAKEVKNTLTVEWSNDETLSSEISHLEGRSVSENQHIDFNFGKDTAVFKCGFGFDFTEEQLFQDGVSSSNSTTQHEGGSESQEVTIPAHTAIQQYTTKNDYTSTVKYDCPVKISFKVTIFSMNGEYYDDNAATTYFTTVDYEQRSFLTQFGNESDGTNAVENLNERMSKDSGYDRTHGVTRGTLVNHGYGKDTKTWDEPWVDHLDYSAISAAADKIGLSPGYSETSKFLSTNQPLSITGATLKRTGKSINGFIGEALPIYSLDKVKARNKLTKVVTSIDVMENSSYHLGDLEMEALNTENVDFFGFTPERGYWAIVNSKGKIRVDDNGDPVEKTNTISLSKNDSGEFVLKGLQAGKAYIKYFVDEKAYQLSDGSYVDPTKVTTPMITVMVSADIATATRIDTPETVEYSFEEGEVVDIEDIEDLYAVVVDENGKTMNVDAQWESNESGISIKDNVLTINNAGKYTIKAKYKNVISNPVNLILIPTDKADDLENTMSGFLNCSSKDCSIAEACLSIKNKLGKESSLNEIIYSEALMQLGGVESGSQMQKEYELQAVLWAMDNNLFENTGIGMVSANGGITELQLAILCYNAAVNAGGTTECDDLISQYSGAEGLSEFQKTALNWAISKGILSDSEESSKTLNYNRVITDAEVAETL